MIGSSGLVAGWISTPSRDSNSERPRARENRSDSLSPCFWSIGDHPATLPAIMPAITVVAPRAELDRDLLLLERLRESGVGAGEPKLSSRSTVSPVGVRGRELVRDLEPLRERGRNVSTGCCIANLRLFKRPPLTLLRKLNSSFTSASGFGKRNCCSSSEMVSSGLSEDLRFR